MEAKNYEWIITGKVIGTIIDGAYHIKSIHNPIREAVLRYDGQDLTFDGVRIEVYDDFMTYLVVMDEIAEFGHSEPYHE